MFKIDNLKKKIKRRLEDLKLDKIKNQPRYTLGRTDILGKELVFVDSASFNSSYRTIFRHKVYDFQTQTDEPRIIDCGSNIGLSVIFFKNIYPKSEIIAFEADKDIFNVLKKNIEGFELNNIELINKAVWSKDAELYFEADSADSGHLSHEEKGSKVSAVALNPFLKEKVDFLKMDIEGAELEVLKSIAGSLDQVENLFIEYHSFLGVDQGLDMILKILSSNGFRYVIHEDGKHAKSPFCHVDTSNGMDLQLSIFAKRGKF